jgi:signal transduction histidine kinase
MCGELICVLLPREQKIKQCSARSDRCSVLISVEVSTRTLQKICAARRLAIQVDVSLGHFIRGQREDLEEMLGNLLDNACKGAESKR